TADTPPPAESPAKPSKPEPAVATTEPANMASSPTSTATVPTAATPATPTSTPPAASPPFMTGPNATGTSSTIAHPKQDDNKTTEGSAQSDLAKKEPETKDQSKEKTGKDDEEEFVLGESGNTQASLLKSLQPLKKPASVIDVKSRLAQPLSFIEFSGQSLATAVRVLSGLSGVPITFDLDCMEQIRPLCSARVQFRLECKTVRDCLDETAKLSKLLVQEKNGRILLTMPDKDALVATSFDLANLASGGPDKADAAQKSTSAPASTPSTKRALSTAITQGELTQLVQEMISPGSWETAGGKGTLHWEKQSLHVNQTANRNIAMKRLFEQLRAIRKLSSQADMAKELLVPEMFRLWTLLDSLPSKPNLKLFSTTPNLPEKESIANRVPRFESIIFRSIRFLRRS
ncbi:MAG: hypothetical protein Q4G59_09120, partial [Planctomycetia bacterium]|nr:hypothetical protein [Planctomycetia bacterium]